MQTNKMQSNEKRTNEMRTNTEIAISDIEQPMRD